MHSVYLIGCRRKISRNVHEVDIWQVKCTIIGALIFLENEKKKKMYDKRE